MTEELIQRSEAWRMARVGHVTASKVFDLLKTNKGGAYSAKRANYLDFIVAERISGKPQDWKEVRSLAERAKLEPAARAWYALQTGNDVDEVGFIKHPTIEYAGCSPDGLIKKTGGLEIKCLDAGNHLKMFTDERGMLEYLPQCHFGMACTGRKWWDFIAFNPTMPEDVRMFRRTIKRDDDLIAKIESAVIEFLAEVDDRIAAIRGNSIRAVA